MFRPFEFVYLLIYYGAEYSQHGLMHRVINHGAPGYTKCVETKLNITSAEAVYQKRLFPETGGIA